MFQHQCVRLRGQEREVAEYMNIVFYLAAAIAILATVMTITRWNAVHGLLYLIVSLLAVAVLFFTLGAPLVAALEVIIYAGAIMVLFIFVVMILNLAPQANNQEHGWLTYRMMVFPALLVLVLLAERSMRCGRSPARRPDLPISPRVR